jgi:hypothetical protein
LCSARSHFFFLAVAFVGRLHFLPTSRPAFTLFTSTVTAASWLRVYVKTVPFGTPLLAEARPEERRTAVEPEPGAKEGFEEPLTTILIGGGGGRLGRPPGLGGAGGGPPPSTSTLVGSKTLGMKS